MRMRKRKNHIGEMITDNYQIQKEYGAKSGQRYFEIVCLKCGAHKKVSLSSITQGTYKDMCEHAFNF